ncbi:MAG: hypothetical protein BroJett011_49760 [Chloroflexota bacterium]|nr:MAG: hypothetical protein BroJett011_49760 [Chloroflexota bacterium]
MNETILLGRGHQMIPVPSRTWQEHLAQAPQYFQTRLGFMTEAHHRVRYFVVRELPALGEPIRPEFIAQKLGLPLTQVEVILDELERHLVFLVRNAQGAVAWAYPVTVDPTPHHLTFSTGEQVYAA